MRVLHVHSGNLYGGIEAMLVTLARCRDLCPSMKPQFALCFEGRLSRELAETGVRIEFVGGARVRRPLSILKARRQLASIIRESPVDVVICHSPWSYAMFAPVIRKVKTRLVMWLHGTVNGRHWLERWAAHTRPDLAICNSQYTRSTLPALYSDVLSSVVYCPVSDHVSDRSQFARDQTRKDLGVSAGDVLIVQVSRIEAGKGHMLLLESLALLKHLKNWTACVVGGAQRIEEHRYLSDLKHAADKFGLSNRVRFVGQSTNVPGILAAADIHCQPNVGPEGYGITFIEALYAGLPLVTTAIGGAREIVNDSCGILVPPGQPEQLGYGLAQLIEDRDLRNALGRAGPERARQLCDPKTQMSKIFETLRSISESVN